MVGRLSDNEIEDALNLAERNLQTAGLPISEALRPPAGPYALFHHISHALERIVDVRLVLSRMFRNRARLTETQIEENRIRPDDWQSGEPFPDEVQRVMRVSRELTHRMKLDFESLYLFGGIALDQWALIAAYLCGIERPEKMTYCKLIEAMEDGTAVEPLRAVKDRLWEEMLWLNYQLRFYRNRFVVHADRPWQRGTTAMISGDSFDLFTPSPPGWLDDEMVNAEIRGLLPLAPQWLQDEDEEYWERARPRRLLEVLFMNIGTIPDKTDRKRVSDLMGKVGGSTPTFQIVASVLAYFLAEGTPTLFDAAIEHNDQINLGPSHAGG